MAYHEINYRQRNVPEDILLTKKVWEESISISAGHEKELEERVKDIEKNPFDDTPWQKFLEKIEEKL